MLYKIIFVLTAVAAAATWTFITGYILLDWYLFAMGV